MFAYRLQQLRHDDLVRRAERERQVREAVRLRRAARHEAAARGAGPGSPPGHHRRDRLARAA